MKSLSALLVLVVGVGSLLNVANGVEMPERRVKVLFLGDQGHHTPRLRARQFYSPAAISGIDITYTEDVNDLNPTTLGRYDVLMIYANIDRITPEQETALLDYVRGGHGLAAIHCASFCFLNSPKYIALVGAQFQSHQTGTFRTKIVAPDHPIMKGLEGFESWDETYVHTKHNEQNRTVLEMRDTEPYTWVRTEEKGRVFYTAWGHDERTWGNPGFVELLKRGIRWSAGDWAMGEQKQLPAFSYQDAKLPKYIQGARWGVNESKLRPMQIPVSSDESMKHMNLAPGFSLHRFASDPDIYKPICMNWDERGRLWIAETIDYPNAMQQPGEGHDRIVICESTKHDGVADKFTVFADKLSIPTSLVFANGGVIVAQAPDMVYLRDTTGSGVANERKVLFSGWGIGDTHAGPSNLHLGFDGWVYGTVGYSGFEGTVGGQPLRFSQGFFRFKPDGSRLEFLGSTNNNTWGLGLSEDGNVFASTANDSPTFFLSIPNRYIEQAEGLAVKGTKMIADTPVFFPATDKIRQVDNFGAYTAGAGSELYTARSFPKSYWNHVQFITEPTGHLVGQFLLNNDGSDFSATNDFNLLTSNDEWTAPIAAATGPDGAVWVIDWYNYIVQHNPIPEGFVGGKGGAYQSDLRDKTHGRIYRVVWDAAKPTENLDLHDADAHKLVATLKNDNLFWRVTAQRLLVEHQDKSIIPELIELTKDQSLDEIGLNPGVIHALWTLKQLGALEDEKSVGFGSAVAGLKHPSAAVRKNAVQVLPATNASTEAILASGLLVDAEAQVRKATLLALSQMPESDEAGAAILAMLARPENAKDLWIPSAAAVAACRHDAGFQKSLFAQYKSKPGTPVIPLNLLPNPSFEEVENGLPRSWRVRDYTGGPTIHDIADEGHSGEHSLRIASAAGSDASCFVDVDVEPNTDYVLSGWIKTQGLVRDGGMGALMNVHGTEFRTNAVEKDGPWQRVETHFNSGPLTRLSINCLFGGWGHSKGAAYFDDVSLSTAPTAGLPPLVGRATSAVINHYAHRAPVDSVMQTLTAARQADPGLLNLVVGGLASGWPAGTAPKLTGDDEAMLHDLMKRLPADTKDAMLSLAARWNRPDLFAAEQASLMTELKARVTDSKLDWAARQDAAAKLVGLDTTPASAKTVILQIDAHTPPEIQRGLVTALEASPSADVGQLLVSNWTRLGAGAQRSAIGLLLRKPQWTAALLDGLERRTIQKGDLRPQDMQLLKLNADPAIAQRAEQVEQSLGQGSSPDKQKLTASLLPLAARTGDVMKGRAVFEKNCIVCHTFEGKGAIVGPNLTGIGARPKSENLIDIVDPNRSVEGTYKMWTAVTTNGDTFVGRLASESKTSVEIIDTAGRHVIERTDLKVIRSSNKSIMPEGFEALAPDDLVNVLEYLATSKVKKN